MVCGPFWNASFAEDYVRRTAEEHERQLQALVEFGQHFPQYAYLMLKYCATFRIHYLYALVPWDIAGDTYTRAHDCILSTFRRIVELPDASEDVCDYVRDRLSLPHRDGGFALVNPKHVADNALVANWCACAAFLAKAVPSLRHIGGPPPVRRAGLSLEWASLGWRSIRLRSSAQVLGRRRNRRGPPARGRGLAVQSCAGAWLGYRSAPRETCP